MKSSRLERSPLRQLYSRCHLDCGWHQAGSKIFTPFGFHNIHLELHQLCRINMAAKIEDCDCGFVDSDDPTQSIFTSLLAIDFTSATNKDLEGIFIKATYNVTQAHAPYVRDFFEEQVRFSSRGLELTVSPSPDGRTVPSAAIFSRSSSFSFGSYRARFLVGRIPGSVTAFYNYKNDNSEVDIEYVSARPPALLYSTKPQLYSPDGNPLASTLQQDTFNGSAAAFDDNFHEWSFIWLPDIIHYGIDSNYSKSITTNIPQEPGRIALSHWSNGDPNYSQGPPTQDSTVVASFFQAVYNDTEAGALACMKTTTACPVKDGLLIPPGVTMPDSTTVSSGVPNGVQSGISDAAGHTAASASPIININAAHGLYPTGLLWLLMYLLVFVFKSK